jgi:hypothetical protein
MKKIAWYISLFGLAVTVQAQTADEVITKYMEAMGAKKNCFPSKAFIWKAPA